LLVEGRRPALRLPPPLLLRPPARAPRRLRLKSHGRAAAGQAQAAAALLPGAAAAGGAAIVGNGAGVDGASLAMVSSRAIRVALTEGAMTGSRIELAAWTAAMEALPAVQKTKGDPAFLIAGYAKYANPGA
jgi:hypothetical protein